MQSDDDFVGIKIALLKVVFIFLCFNVEFIVLLRLYGFFFDYIVLSSGKAKVVSIVLMLLVVRYSPESSIRLAKKS